MMMSTSSVNMAMAEFFGGSFANFNYITFKMQYIACHRMIEIHTDQIITNAYNGALQHMCPGRHALGLHCQ